MTPEEIVADCEAEIASDAPLEWTMRGIGFIYVIDFALTIDIDEEVKT